ncbi:MAG: HAMP domain-containing histidine kinase [Oscillospiraceae bacterium]|nr:HAMP domain-containing histidine kinase [Oscillospiraceae bacterium]
MRNRELKLRSIARRFVWFCIFIVFAGEIFVFYKSAFLGFADGYFSAVDSIPNSEVYVMENHYLTIKILSTVFSIVTFVLFYIFAKKYFIVPVEELADGMERVGKGNLDVRISEGGKFEFGEIQKTFNLMVEQLQNDKKNREKIISQNTMMYSGIAHDLKTPMTMIIGYAKFLQSNSDISQKDRQRYLDNIISKTEDANKLLDSLFTYSKLENSSYELKKEKHDIAECLRSCVADHYKLIEKSGIKLELDIPESKTELVFDKFELKRVFSNLIMNVIKHNPENTECFISLSLSSSMGQYNDIVKIIIADDGPKISSSLIEKLFDCFSVGDLSRNTRNGSGLGLAISQKIIERHDGKLYYCDVWNSKYKCFVVELKNRLDM